MNEIAMIARVFATICLGSNIALLWLAMRQKWPTMYFVWLVAFGVFNMILQWTTGLAWWLAVVSVAICSVAMLIIMIRAWRRFRRLQAMRDAELAEINAERQRVLDVIARQHEELMQTIQVAQISEEVSDDQ